MQQCCCGGLRRLSVQSEQGLRCTLKAPSVITQASSRPYLMPVWSYYRERVSAEIPELFLLVLWSRDLRWRDEAVHTGSSYCNCMLKVESCGSRVPRLTCSRCEHRQQLCERAYTQRSPTQGAALPPSEPGPGSEAGGRARASRRHLSTKPTLHTAAGRPARQGGVRYCNVSFSMATLWNSCCRYSAWQEVVDSATDCSHVHVMQHDHGSSAHGRPSQESYIK